MINQTKKMLNPTKISRYQNVRNGNVNVVSIEEMIEYIKSPKGHDRIIIEAARTKMQDLVAKNDDAKTIIDSFKSFSKNVSTILDVYGETKILSKSDLSSYMIAGVISNNKTDRRISCLNDFESMTGLIQLDFDFKGRKDGFLIAQSVKNVLVSNEFIKFVFISFSGVGVKAAVQIDVLDLLEKGYNLTETTEFTEPIQKYFSELVKEKLNDNTLEDADVLPYVQLVFASMDEDAYYNANSKQFDYQIAFDFFNEKGFKAKKQAPKEKLDKAIKKEITFNPIRTKVISDEFMYQHLSPVFEQLVLEGNPLNTTMVQTITGLGKISGYTAEQIRDFLISTEKGGKWLKPNFYETVLDLFNRENMPIKWPFQPNKVVESIKVNKYISEAANVLTKYLDKDFILKAPTGSGKSSFILNLPNRKFVFVVHLTMHMEQILNQYNDFGCYYEQKKDYQGKDKIIVTADSLPNLVRDLNGKANEYTLFFDECHNLTVSSSENYKHDALFRAMKAASSFKNRVFISATPIFNLDLQYRFLPIVEIETSIKISKKAIVTKYKNDGLQTAVYHAANNSLKDSDTLTVFYLNNTSDKLTKTEMLLKSFDVNYSVINSQSKLESAYVNITKENKIDLGISAIITTSIMKEAINVINHRKHVVIYTLSSVHTEEIEQIANRYRNAETITVFWMKKDNGNDENGFYFNLFSQVLYLQEQNILNYKRIKADILNDSFGNAAFVNNSFTLCNDSNCHVCIDNNDELELSYLKMSNRIYTSKGIAEHRNDEMKANELSQYGWTTKVMEEVLEYDFDKEKQALFKETIAAEKVEKDTLLHKTALQYISNKYSFKGIDAPEDIKNNVKNRVDYLLKMGIEKGVDMIEILKTYKNDNQFSIFKNMAIVQILFSEKNKQLDAFRYFNEIKKSFKVNKAYTPSEKDLIVNEIRLKHGLSKVKSTKVANTVELVFETKQKKSGSVRSTLIVGDKKFPASIEAIVKKCNFAENIEEIFKDM